MFQFEIMVSKQLFFDDIIDHKYGISRGEHLLSQFGPVCSPHIFLTKVLERHKYIKEHLPKALIKNDFLANKTIWELRETETNLLAHYLKKDDAPEVKEFAFKFPLYEIK